MSPFKNGPMSEERTGDHLNIGSRAGVGTRVRVRACGDIHVCACVRSVCFVCAYEPLKKNMRSTNEPRWP